MVVKLSNSIRLVSLALHKWHRVGSEIRNSDDILLRSDICHEINANSKMRGSSMIFIFAVYAPS